jgi:hypothetical protein
MSYSKSRSENGLTKADSELKCQFEVRAVAPDRTQHGHADGCLLCSDVVRRFPLQCLFHFEGGYERRVLLP